MVAASDRGAGKVELRGFAAAHRRERAPRERDPAVRAPPDVLALDDRAGLLVQHGDARFGDPAGAEVATSSSVAPVSATSSAIRPWADVRSTKSGTGGSSIGSSRPLIDPGVELDADRGMPLKVVRWLFAQHAPLMLRPRARPSAMAVAGRLCRQLHQRTFRGQQGADAAHRALQQGLPGATARGDRDRL